MRNKKIIALAIATLSYTSFSFANNMYHHQMQHNQKTTKNIVRCMGITSCKDMPNCVDPCKGKLICKEKGFVLTTKKHCDHLRASNHMTKPMHSSHTTMQSNPNMPQSQQNTPVKTMR